MIIGLTGLLGSGKSEVANHLVQNHGFLRIKFAGPLKDMMRALGLSEHEIEGDLKEKPCDLLCGKSPRYAMQTIGTEWGRDIIDPNLWVSAWRAAVERTPANACIVADDVRFPNEAETMRSMTPHAAIVRVHRESAKRPASHSSETYAFPVDFVLSNDSSLEALYSKVDRILRL